MKRETLDRLITAALVAITVGVLFFIAEGGQ